MNINNTGTVKSDPCRKTCTNHACSAALPVIIVSEGEEFSNVLCVSPECDHKGDHFFTVHNSRLIKDK